MLLSSVLTLSLVVLPVVAIGIVMSTDVIKFAYMRGQFTLENAKLTGGILAFYVVGLPAFGMRDFLNRMFHALKDTKTPFRVSCIVVAVNIALNIILRKFMGANGLAFATSIAGYVGMAALIILLKKRFGHIGFKKILVELAKIVISTGVCAAVCLVMNRMLPEAMGTLHVFLRLAAAAGVSLVVYVICCVVLRVKPLKDFAKMLRRG